MIKIKLTFLLFLNIIYLSILSSCTEPTTEESIRIRFNDSTQYYSYRQHGMDGYEVAIVKTRYDAKIEIDNEFVRDTTYLNNSLYYNLDNSEWIYRYTFGSDILLEVVKQDIDSFFVHYGTELCKFDFKDSFNISITEFDMSDSLQIVEYSNIIIDSVVTDEIDSLNSSNRWYTPYQIWKEEIIGLY